MSQSQLDALQRTSSNSGSSRRRTLVSIIFGLVLLAAFGLLMVLVFGERIYPRVEVRVASAVLLPETAQPESSSERAATPGRMVAQASGWIEPDPYPIRVPVLVDGFVEQVLVLEGEPVRAGQLLATLDSTNAMLKLERSRAELAAAQARITAAESERDAARFRAAESDARWQRVSRLQSDDMAEMEREEVQRMQAEAAALLAKAEAHVELAKQERQEAARRLDQAQVDAARNRISSPIDGVILKRFAAPGMKRMAGMDDINSSSIVSLYDPDRLQVRVDVPLSDFGRIATGMLTRIHSAAFTGRSFSGRVTRLTGQADITRNTVQVKVEIDEPDKRMRPEMLCRVEFLETGSGSAASAFSGSARIWIPAEALINESGGIAQVWVVDPVRVQSVLREVETDLAEQDGYRWIPKGLRPGERVVLRPPDTLRDGARVRIITENES